MKNRTLTLVLALAVVALLVGSPAVAEVETRSSSVPVPRMLKRPGLPDAKELSLQAGSRVTAYTMSWDDGGPDQAAKRLTGAVEVMLGKAAASRVIDDESLVRAANGENAGSWTRLGASPVLVRYQEEFNEIRLIHEELDRVTRPARDVGEKGALEAAEELLKRLGEAGVIDPRLFESSAVQIGYKMVGAGAVGKTVKPGRIVEYRFTYRPRLRGIEMANAGLRLGILASGELASMRVGGVTPAGEWRDGRLTSTVEDARRKVRVGVDELMRRFYESVPKGAEPQIAWSRVMYAMPEGAKRALVEPMLLVSYSLRTEADGEPVVSRRKTIGYSLTDPDAKPVDFDAPPARHEGTEPRRQESKQGG